MDTLQEIAYSYVGVKEGTAAYNNIVKAYNKVKPLPRGYKLKTGDPWCAAFATVCMDKAGIKDAPRECSADKMLHKCKTVVTDPQPGDLVFYDWQKNGTADHVGIVNRVKGTTLEVVEGNYNHMVRLRYVLKTNGAIYRFARVQESDIHTVAMDVIRGKYGNGNERKKRLAAAGYDYETVQAEVNKILKKST